MGNLQDATRKLRDAVALVEADLTEQAQRGYIGRPELARDSSGRYILLDAYAALVNGEAALAAARRSS